MLQSVPPRASAKPRLIGPFACVTPITFQVTTPNTLYVAETEQQLMMMNDDGTIDALEINQASGIVILWARGALYLAGSQLPGVTFKPYIYIPDVHSGGLVVPGGGQAYGMESPYAAEAAV
jgi:hypothetical protein